MLARWRRRANGAALLINVPVNAMSRAGVDAEVGRVRGCVIPLIRNKGGRPYLEGSAVALVYRGRKVLATALHVLTANKDRQLWFFAHDTYVRPLHGYFEISEVHDLAVALLDADAIAALAHIPFLKEESIGSAVNESGAFYASVAGYPHTASRLKDRQTLDTPMEVISGRGTELPDGVVSVVFDKKCGAWGAKGHVLARDPIGKSGGAIFGMRVMGLNAVQPWYTPKLVGIPTEWKGKQILGASAAALIPLLDRLVAPR